ncbi:MAG: SEC-C metal-binding domain-containing protein [Candidatus Electronema sp. VV]
MDKDFIITTPKEITQQINNFCLEIEPAINPIFVPVKPVDSARYNYCLTDVPVYSQKHGGSVQFGWIIWELKNIWIEAEFHACWINNDNIIIDITPKPDCETQILFLPDSKRVYEDKIIANIRKPLIENESIRMLLIIENKKDEIRAKHYSKESGVDSEAETTEYQEWYAKFIDTLNRNNKKIGRNDLCFCGSGLKYKKCCL